ncbi:unnamed protein product, partial [Rotaria sp. Silwood1]
MKCPHSKRHGLSTYQGR